MDCVVRAWVRALPVRLRVRTRIMVPNCMHTARQRPGRPRHVVSLATLLLVLIVPAARRTRVFGITNLLRPRRPRTAQATRPSAALHGARACSNEY